MNQVEFIESLPVEFRDKLRNLPNKPGVYLYKDKSGKVIYIGKASKLRHRVYSYFQSSKHHDAKTNALLRHIADLDFILTHTEAEALILEDTLVKRYKPRYNVMLRDDKTYPFIRITNEEYPRIFSTRKIVRDGSKYFGPFTDAKAMKRLIKLIRSIFKLRSCKLKLTEESIAQRKFKLCLDYQIKKCEAPCEGLISKTKYLEDVANAIRVINGKSLEVEKILYEKMEDAANNLDFEQAAYYRNQYFLLKEFSSTQKIASTELIDRDVFGFAEQDNLVCIWIFNIREGKLINKRHFILKNKFGLSPQKILQMALEKWYIENEFIPDEILLPFEPEEMEFIHSYLDERKKKHLSIHIPKVGDKKKLVKLANENAEFQIKEYTLTLMKKDAELPKRILDMQKDLQLERPPRKIECFDNSHIQGSELVSSVVVFKNGKPAKSEYRKYKIKTVAKSDDFLAIREVVFRRYKRLLDEAKELPDLIIIDGGKGHLNEAIDVLKELNIFDKVSIISIAKKLEQIYKPNIKEPITLAKTSATLQMIQQIRDEAHRFAITYHRLLRKKRTIETELLNIEGIGEKTANKLLKTFGSVKQIKESSEAEIAKIVGNKIAKRILEYFNS
ncbi:MAG: excinuclease ABC subunit UvrC [Ignavibacteria bacterium]|nr:excinuclease ABC subunit UvrC [Ignavibacteria bacterium]